MKSISCGKSCSVDSFRVSILVLSGILTFFNLVKIKQKYVALHLITWPSIILNLVRKLKETVQVLINNPVVSQTLRRNSYKVF